MYRHRQDFAKSVCSLSVISMRASAMYCLFCGTSFRITLASCLFKKSFLVPAAPSSSFISASVICLSILILLSYHFSSHFAIVRCRLKLKSCFTHIVFIPSLFAGSISLSILSPIITEFLGEHLLILKLAGKSQYRVSLHLLQQKLQQALARS